jgi:hypothetical protein
MARMAATTVLAGASDVLAAASRLRYRDSKITCGYRAGMARSAVPPWRRVADDLRRRIESGEFSPGAPLPSLTSLAEQYQVSRTTARKAVDAIRDDGLVESVRGWGTFVRRD